MNKIDVQSIKNVPETMLIPLWAKAAETTRPEPIIQDYKACEIVSLIDYDFSKFREAWMSQTGVSIRTYILDNAVKNFIDSHSDTVIINLGAGLDTRYTRMDADKIFCWYDLDLPEAINLRRSFFQENEKNRFISGSVFDFSWMDKVDRKGKPVLIIAEGLFMYFTEEELRPLFGRLAERFPGGEIFFEMMASFIVGKSKHHDSVTKMQDKPEFKWGLKDSRDMEKWNGRIKFLKEWNYFDYFRKRWRYFRFLFSIPGLKKIFSNRIVHMSFFY